MALKRKLRGGVILFLFCLLADHLTLYERLFCCYQLSGSSKCTSAHLRVWVRVGEERFQGPISERKLRENSEYFNPEIRKILGFPFQSGRFVELEKAG